MNFPPADFRPQGCDMGEMALRWVSTEAHGASACLPTSRRAVKIRRMGGRALLWLYAEAPPSMPPPGRTAEGLTRASATMAGGGGRRWNDLDEFFTQVETGLRDADALLFAAADPRAHADGEALLDLLHDLLVPPPPVIRSLPPTRLSPSPSVLPASDDTDQTKTASGSLLLMTGTEVAFVVQWGDDALWGIQIASSGEPQCGRLSPMAPTMGRPFPFTISAPQKPEAEIPGVNPGIDRSPPQGIARIHRIVMGANRRLVLGGGACATLEAIDIGDAQRGVRADATLALLLDAAQHPPLPPHGRVGEPLSGMDSSTIAWVGPTSFAGPRLGVEAEHAMDPSEIVSPHEDFNTAPGWAALRDELDPVRESSLFQKLSWIDLLRLRPHLRVEWLPRGTSLPLDGAIAPIGVVLEGRVRIDHGIGRPLNVDSGEVLGERGLNDTTWTYSAVTVHDTLWLTLDAAPLLDLTSRYPALGRTLLNALLTTATQRLRALTELTPGSDHRASPSVPLAASPITTAGNRQAASGTWMSSGLVLSNNHIPQPSISRPEHQVSANIDPTFVATAARGRASQRVPESPVIVTAVRGRPMEPEITPWGNVR